jgi:hypothetical protein
LRSRLSNVSPDFRKAKTEEELRFELLKLQNELGGEVQYLSVYFNGTDHVAWFFNDLDSMVLAEKLKQTRE